MPFKKLMLTARSLRFRAAGLGRCKPSEAVALLQLCRCARDVLLLCPLAQRSELFVGCRLRCGLRVSIDIGVPGLVVVTSVQRSHCRPRVYTWNCDPGRVQVITF